MTTYTRIKPEEVVEAYKATKTIPANNAWGYYDDDGDICACGMTSVLMKRRNYSYSVLSKKKIGRLTTHVYTELLELPLDYVEGFANGFDGMKKIRAAEGPKEYDEGFDDGAAAYKAVVEEFGEVRDGSEDED